MQKLSPNHKHLRLELTTPEQKLWSALRARRCVGLKFRRQVPIGPYVVDFFCLEKNLVIEVDGDDHARRVKSDRRRTDFLQSLGYAVLRFDNQDVMRNINGVTEQITMQVGPEGLDSLPPHPPKGDAFGPLPLPLGEGYRKAHP